VVVLLGLYAVERTCSCSGHLSQHKPNGSTNHPSLIRPEQRGLGKAFAMQDLPGMALIRFDLILESVAAIIAYLISHNANKAYHMTGQKKLSDLSTGFLVLCAAMFGRVIGTIYFFVLMESGDDVSLMITVVTIAYGGMKIMAYILFVFSTLPAKSNPIAEKGLLLALPALVDPNLDFVAIIVLLVVVLLSSRNYLSSRSKYALYVFLGFTCLLLSHLAAVLSMDEIGGYLLSQVLQFLGFLLLLVMLLKAGREQ